VALSLWRGTSDQRGAYNRVVAPDYLVRTILEVSAAGEVQHKFVGDPDAKRRMIAYNNGRPPRPRDYWRTYFAYEARCGF
jgi:hypothetical protein